MISLLISLLIIGLIFSLIYWVLGLLPIPQPAKNIILAIMAIIFVLYLISALLPLGSTAAWHPLWR